MTSARARRRSASRNRTVDLQLDARIYTQGAIERTRRAFAHLAAIDVRNRGGKWTVRFSQAAPEMLAQLPDEFANHALSCLMVDQ